MSIPVNNMLSHWSHLFPFFSMSSESFYSKVEHAVKNHDLPDIKITRITHKEQGVFSSSREYLRVKRRNLVFDICAAPFGKDFFISSWLYETESGIQTIFKYTKVGNVMRKSAAKRTFFQADEETMFRSCVHQCVLETIDQLTEGKGVRLTELERQMKQGGM